MVETIQNTQNSNEGNSSSRSSSRLSATHDGHEFDQDEEQTMRLKIGAGSNESVLERARSLAQRNKLVRNFFVVCYVTLDLWIAIRQTSCWEVWKGLAIIELIEDSQTFDARPFTGSFWFRNRA